jgi:hypothetical protein
VRFILRVIQPLYLVTEKEVALCRDPLLSTFAFGPFASYCACETTSMVAGRSERDVVTS